MCQYARAPLSLFVLLLVVVVLGTRRLWVVVVLGRRRGAVRNMRGLGGRSCPSVHKAAQGWADRAVRDASVPVSITRVISRVDSFVWTSLGPRSSARVKALMTGKERGRHKIL